MSRMAELLGVGTAEKVREWVCQAGVDAGTRVGTGLGGDGRAVPDAAGERRTQARWRPRWGPHLTCRSSERAMRAARGFVIKPGSPGSPTSTRSGAKRCGASNADLVVQVWANRMIVTPRMSQLGRSDYLGRGSFATQKLALRGHGGQWCCGYGDTATRNPDIAQLV